MTRARHPASASLVAALATTLLGACATQVGTVVLLPERDGGASTVIVQQGEQKLPLTQPYDAAELTTRGPRAATSSAQEVERLFGPALAAQPARAARFTLYFVEGTDDFTEDSKRILEGVFSEIAGRPVPDVVVVGHTDSVGTDPVNDALARQRAETVRSALIRRGIAPENVVAVGRGKREPAVPTPDGVAEPRNRRVEILVR